MKSITSRIIGVFFVLFMLTFMVTTGVLEEQKEKDRLIKSTKICGEMAEIESVLYTRGSRIRKLVKVDGSWVWEDDTDIVADQIAVNEKIEALLQIKAIDKVKDVQSREEYGVDEPTYSVTLTDINQKTVTVSLGKTNKENNYYVKINEQEDIYIVTNEMKKTIIALDSSRTLQEQLDSISSPTRYR